MAAAPKGTLREFLARYPQHRVLKISQLARWRKNASGNTSFFVPAAGGWGLKFAADGGWAYPQFPLPSGIHAKRVVAVLVRARVAKPAQVRLMTFNQRDQPVYCTLVSPIIAANGKLQTVLVPLSRFKSMGNGHPLHSLARARFLSVGLNNNSDVGENQLEVSKLYLLYGR